MVGGKPNRDSPQPDSQRCCLGLLYYSQTREEQGKRPVCLGFPHTPTEPVHINENRQAAETPDFKFFCLGQSLYERPMSTSQGSAADGTVKRSMPYCEGLEVMFGAATEAMATRTATGSAATASTPAAAGAGSGLAAGRQQQQPDDLAAVLTSIFGGEDSPIVRGASKFNKVAQRNLDRMKSSANQMYSMTLKPLIDKLSGDQ